MVRRIAILLVAALGMTACSTLKTPTCGAGEQPMRTAQLFFGQIFGGRPAVTSADSRRLTAAEVSTRLPASLAGPHGGGQWKGHDDKLIREASKVVLLVMPLHGGDVNRKLGEVRLAYKTRFHQDSVMMIAQKACVAF